MSSLCVCHGLSAGSLSVCTEQWAGLLKKLRVNFRESFGIGSPRNRKQLIKFWGYPNLGQGICLVNRCWKSYFYGEYIAYIAPGKSQWMIAANISMRALQPWRALSHCFLLFVFVFMGNVTDSTGVLLSRSRWLIAELWPVYTDRRVCKAFSLFVVVVFVWPTCIHGRSLIR